MANTPIRGIPYPNEYEDPFYESFEDMLSYLDSNVEVRYSPRSGFTLVGPSRYEFVGTIPLDQLGGVGMPMRHRDNDYDPWEYGVIREWDSVSSPSVMTFDGAPALGVGTQLEFGGAAQIHQHHMFFSGNFNSSNAQGLFYSQKNEAFRWDGPPAYLVRCTVHCKTTDSNSNPYINPVVNRANILLPSAEWHPISIAERGDGIECDDGFTTTVDSMDPKWYRINTGDVLDVNVRKGGMDAGDAADLSVEFTLVYEGEQDQYCVGGYPPVILTIVGLSGGNTWQGLGDGVHTLCPSAYQSFRSRNYLSPTSYTLQQQEYWFLGSGGAEPLKLKANYSTGIPGPGSMSSYLYMKYTPGSPMGGATYNPTYTSGIYGYIMDRLFQSFTLGTATFTLQRGTGRWGAV